MEKYNAPSIHWRLASLHRFCRKFALWLPLIVAFVELAHHILRRPSLFCSHCHKTHWGMTISTQQCHGRGTPVQSTKGGRLCWRCACSRTTEQGRGRVWAGAACEKQDYSSETLLFIGTFLVLFVSIVASCALLYREGTHELPGTLSSVSLRS